MILIKNLVIALILLHSPGNLNTPIFIDSIGTNGSGNGEFDRPLGVAINGTNLFVVDQYNDRIQIFDLSGNFKMQFGEPGFGNGQFNLPARIYLNGTYIFVMDNSDRIQIFDHSGNYVTQIYHGGNGMVSNGTHFFIVSGINHKVFIYDALGIQVSQFGSHGTGDGEFDYPYGITANESHILVVDRDNSRIQIFDMMGKFKGKFGAAGVNDGEFNFLTAFDPVGIVQNGTHIFVTDLGNNRIQIFDLAGNFQAKFGVSGSINGQFNTPTGIAVNNTHILVADKGNNRIQIFKISSVLENNESNNSSSSSSFSSSSSTSNFMDSVVTSEPITSTNLDFTTLIGGILILSFYTFKKRKKVI